MRSRKLKTLGILSCFAILTACADQGIDPVPCPLYPELIPLDPELAAEVSPIVKEIVVQNYLLLDEYAQKLEVRAGCDNSSIP